MPTLSDFIVEIGKRANITEDVMKDILSNAELTKINLPEAFTNTTYSNLMNEQQAKSSQAVKAFFKADNLDPIDKDLKRFAAELSDPDFLTSFNSNTSTYAKFPLLIEQIKKTEAAKAKAEYSGKKVDKDELQRQYDELKGQLDAVVLSKDTEINSIKSTTTSQLSELALKYNLNGYDWANPYPDANLNVMVAREAVNTAASKKGAKIIFNAEKQEFELRNINDVSLPYTENHNQVAFKDFLDGTMAENKLLKVSGGTPPPVPPRPYVDKAGTPREIPVSLTDQIAESIARQKAAMAGQ